MHIILCSYHMFISYFGYISYLCSYRILDISLTYVHIISFIICLSHLVHNNEAASSYLNGTAVQILKGVMQTPASMTLMQQYCLRTRLLILLITLVLEERMKVVEWNNLMVSWELCCVFVHLRAGNSHSRSPS